MEQVLLTITKLFFEQSSVFQNFLGAEGTKSNFDLQTMLALSYDTHWLIDLDRILPIKAS